MKWLHFPRPCLHSGSVPEGHLRQVASPVLLKALVHFITTSSALGLPRPGLWALQKGGDMGSAFHSPAFSMLSSSLPPGVELQREGKGQEVPSLN